MKHNENELKQISLRILQKIITAGCFFERDNWVDLDHIWQNPEILRSFADLLARYLSIYRKETQFNKVVVPNKVYGPFGVLPIFAVSSPISRIPFIIWKEWGKPATGGSIVYGRILKGDQLLILHDVINYGATPTKEALELREIIRKKEKCKIIGVLSIIDRNRGGINFIEERAKIPAKAILSWNELKRAYQELRSQKNGKDEHS